MDWSITSSLSMIPNKFLDKLATEQIIENIKVLLRTKE